MQPIDLSDFFTTKAEANDFLSSLTTISEMFFQTNFNLEKALTQQLGVNKADRFLTILRENNINPESLPTVKEFVTVLTQKILTLPVITLTVAFEPHEQTLKAVSQWFVINMKKQLLFDIKIDRKLIAGATITYNGKFSDFSIRQTFEQIFKNTLHDNDAPSATVNQNKQPAPQKNPPAPVQQTTPIPAHSPTSITAQSKQPSPQNIHQRVEDISLGR